MMAITDAMGSVRPARSLMPAADDPDARYASVSSLQRALNPQSSAAIALAASLVSLMPSCRTAGAGNR
jgi:hypothetical protein